MDDKVRQELKAKHQGEDLRILTTMGQEFVVKRPSQADWSRFQLDGQDDRKRPAAMKQLVGVCVVYPSQDELAVVFSRFPGLPTTLFGELAEMAGSGVPVEKKDF